MSVCVVMLCVFCCVCRSKDYGHTFVNDTVKWDNDTIVEWYYISPFSEYVSNEFNKLIVLIHLSPSPFSLADIC